MGLLAPLYALAALAIAAPVIFHLIRRQPRGMVEFSSLMFLQPSPPRLTRRSRLDNLWLLLVRAAALGLIALAFARPFLRSAELADAQPAGRDILLLIDTSGSMQRESVWQSALKQARDYIDALGPGDRVGLATFDTELRVVVPLPEEVETAGTSNEASRAAARQELEHLTPGYRGTNLGEQLIAAAELLQLRSTTRRKDASTESEIVLVSDLHEGAGLDALQGYTWPENLRLDIRRVAAAQAGNARATLMQTTAGEPLADDASTRDRIRVRIENNAGSTESAFTLRWLAPGDSADTKAPTTSDAANTVNVQVPPGQTRVVPMPHAVGEVDRIVLGGDQTTFDNIVYVPHTEPRHERLAFIGQPRSKSEDDLFFFLSRVPLSTPVRTVSIERMKTEDLLAAATDERLAGLVVEWPVAAATVPAIEDLVRSGRPVVVVLSRPLVGNDNPGDDTTGTSAEDQNAAEVLKLLLGSEHQVPIEEAAAKDFALLTDIDFRHPLFRPLADAKFNDFGKVRFWSHRVMKLPDDEPSDAQLRVLARFDDHAPALIQRRIGRGNLWLLAAGWQASASQLALSSKFVPLLYGLLDPEGRALETDAVYEVGEPIDVAAGAAVKLTGRDGTPAEGAEVHGHWHLERPGIYWLDEDGKRRQIAVSLPLSESQLDPLDVDRLTQYGVVTGKSDSAKERAQAARLSQVTELENRQKLWRWILVAALALLILETLLAARREKNPQPSVA